MPSTVVSAFHYEAISHKLRVIFITGKVYDYKDVPSKIYQAMKSSSSKGIYFNKYIKGKYEFEKIE
jgi:KTSC domain